MIKNSFIFLDGIDVKKENMIWSQGVRDWDSFIISTRIEGISPFRKKYYDRILLDAKRELLLRNSSFFLEKLPSVETWRLYDYFRDDCLFLDIEAGKNKRIDVMGLYDGENNVTFLREHNFNEQLVKKAISDFKIIATFNGSSFDLPIIKRKFKEFLPNVPHIDIRHLCSKIGLFGGLKDIEMKLNLKRTILFQQRNNSLRNLVNYNQEDVTNLKPILEFCISKLKQQNIFNNIQSF